MWLMALFVQKLVLVLAVVFYLILMPSIVASMVKSEECLDCHEKYRTSAHGNMVCLDCHSTISSLPHEDTLPKPRCTTCHQKSAASFSHDVHKEKGVECSNCHNHHFVSRDKNQCISCHSKADHSSLPSKAKHLSALSCITCHGKPERTDLVVTVRTSGNKEIKSSQIDNDSNRYISKSEWLAFQSMLHKEFRGLSHVQKTYKTEGDTHTVTGKPAPCTACHSSSGYFPTSLLQITGTSHFTIPIDATIFVSELPSISEFSRTAHGKKGIVCVDCHQSKALSTEVWSAELATCVKCHRNIQETYKITLHSKKGATHCIDCHNPHRIKAYKELSVDERVAVCTRCHRNYLEKHSWLPNATLHFNYLECAACHSPRSEKSIIYYFNRKSGRTESILTYDQLKSLLGTDPVLKIAALQDTLTADTQIGKLYSTLAERDNNLFIDASIMVTKAYHDYSETTLKEKECVTCHSGEAQFYNSMFFILPGKTSPNYIPVRGTLISSYPIGDFVDFFLLGENKIRKEDVYALLGNKFRDVRYSSGNFSKLVDLGGILLVILVLLGVFGHALLRLVVKK
jgi:predicted CXXCH cytochrome family protein